MLINLALFTLSFVMLWIGSGIAVSAITKIAHSLRMSSFFISFFVLGLFTSLTEIMVGINSLIKQHPEVFVGNLIGSSVVVFLLVVPLLAVIGKGISLNHSFRFKDLVLAAMVVGTPALLTLDNRITILDAVVCIAAYLYFMYVQEKNTNYLERLVVMKLGRSSMYGSIAKITIAVALIFTASHVLVTQIPIIGASLGVSPYIISILVISIGTNIPEISIAARAVLANKKDVAFGNYVGSATLNTLEMGILSLIGFKNIPAEGSNFSITIFILGLALFLYFGKSGKTISRQEGAILLFCYLFFVVFEIFTGPSWQF